MSDEVTIPRVELHGAVIRIMQISSHREQSVVTIPADCVDEFCESIYWARKQYLTSLNDESRGGEAARAESIPASDHLKPRSMASEQKA